MSTIIDQIDEIKKYSGVSRLKECLEKRLFKSTRGILYAKMNEAFQDFLKQIHDIVEDETEICDARLNILASNEDALVERREKVAEVEALVLQIKTYIEKVRADVGGVK